MRAFTGPSQAQIRYSSSTERGDRHNQVPIPNAETMHNWKLFTRKSYLSPVGLTEYLSHTKEQTPCRAAHDKKKTSWVGSVLFLELFLCSPFFWEFCFVLSLNIVFLYSLAFIFNGSSTCVNMCVLAFVCFSPFLWHFSYLFISLFIFLFICF